MFLDLINILDSTLRISAPLLLASLAGLYAERSGVFDIGLEGKMLAAAFAAAAAATLTPDAILAIVSAPADNWFRQLTSPIEWLLAGFAIAVSGTLGPVWLGLMAAILTSTVLALVHGFACISQRGNQIVSGVAINFVALGFTALLGQAWFSQGGRTPPLSGDAKFADIDFVFAETLADIPLIGPIWAGLLSGHKLLVYVAFAAAPFTWWVLWRTRFGMRLRAVGENPAAVDTAGISVTWLRYRAMICCGILCGLSGAYLSTAQGAGFIINMSAGKGFIALAALIFAKWRPIQAMLACLLFGFLDASAIRLQGFDWFGLGEVPSQAITALPYILTVVLLAGFIGRAVAPKAGGVPYVKER